MDFFVDLSKKNYVRLEKIITAVGNKKRKTTAPPPPKKWSSGRGTTLGKLVRAWTLIA
jgi:hypothetical protein